ncbi:MAG TPA: phosphodiesterase [Candidatus Eremiobacteraceae bacterium]|nr:phosphodiesterase [Candidatus Eremiobacteraceae bacterium]
MERKPYFIQISDSHLFADPAERLWEVAPDPHLDAIVDTLSVVAPEPEFVIVTGDCSADGSPESYRRLREKVARLSDTAYYLPGNHDDAPYMARYLAGRTIGRFEKFTQVFDSCGWRFILLDSSVAGEDVGSIGNEQREWLRARLAADPKMPTIVAVHHNPLPVGSRWLDTMTISDAPALLAVLDTAPQVKLVIFGHVHQEFEARREGTVYASAPSTFFQFKPRATSFGRDERAPGARIVRLGDERVAGKIVRVAMEGRRAS